ncbi:hypothetical protein N7445_006802 [Penicillium cf. griseofulvum]|nr:hypothetical protein N7445_006802 [Penicillium cf. griseofulvum]
MAPRLPPSKLEMIPEAAECSERSIINLRNNLYQFGNIRAPPTRVGRRRSITPLMLEAIYNYLLKKPGLYVTNSSLKRALASVGWSKKEQDADLRDFYLYNLSDFRSYYLVYVDESGYDKRIGFRRTGWSPVGAIPLQVSKFYRSTDLAVFEDFIEQLLKHCGKWPKPKSVVVIDNVSFYYSERIKELCANIGVKLVYLLPYSPDLNPIEEFFSKLKAFIRRNWRRYKFAFFLKWCIEAIGSREESTKGYFRYASVVIEDYY